MKYSTSMAMYGWIYGTMVPDLEKDVRKKLRKEYKAILLRAGDIGQKNMLLGSYTLCAFFIAMNRANGLSADENIEKMRKGMKSSKLLKIALGDAKGYLDEKRMEGRYRWSEDTHKHTYPDDWVVDILPAQGKYALGYDYLECGCCKMCAHEGCPELAKYLCSLDYMLFDVMGMGLDRTQTLAEGGEKCDFRMYLK